MGLDCSHNAWHGAYSAFHHWRHKLAEVAGIPLDLMAGFYRPPYPVAMDWARPREGGPLCGDPCGPFLHRWIEEISAPLPLSWDLFEGDALVILLDHSDCDGEIAAHECGPLADRIEGLLDLLPDEDAGGHIGNWREKTRAFIDGLRLAAERNEPLGFH
jgi:hypothetical protein